MPSAEAMNPVRPQFAPGLKLLQFVHLLVFLNPILQRASKCSV